MSLKTVIVLVLAWWVVAAPAAAQDDRDVIKIRTDLVTFEVTVADRNGRPVPNLTREDFQIFEDGVERDADFFEAVRQEGTGRPLSIVLALDVSGSMTDSEMEKLKTALASFSNRFADFNSYIAITTFAMRVSTVQGFTNRSDRLVSAISKLRRERDGLSTHAYDAVDHAVRLLANKGPKYSANRLTKKAVVLITDGFPVGDIVSPPTVIDRALEGDTAVYALILPSYSRFQPSKRPLITPLEASGVIDKTGGRSFYASGDNFEPLFKALGEEIESTYAIAFYPDRERQPKNQFRNVRIVARKGLTVRQNRTGYIPEVP
ncbi:MAG: VWA domain-containing protein [Pyrinomonadaceae bacterium]